MKTAEFIEKYAVDVVRWGCTHPMEGDELKKFASDLNTLLNDQRDSEYDEGYFDGRRDKAIEIEQAAHDLIPKKKAVRFKPPTPEEVEHMPSQ